MNGVVHDHGRGFELGEFREHSDDLMDVLAR